MPMVSEIDVDRRLVRTRVVGAVTVAEVEEHNRNLGLDPKFNPEFEQLVDLSEMTSILYDFASVRKSAKEHVFSPGVRRALVATSDATYGMSRMFALQSESEGQRIEVFRQMKEAEAWLGL
jgi:hypothetical protein